MSYPLVPHFQYPFHFHDHGDGVAAHVVEQDTEDDVISCVEVILLTPIGFRDEKPEFGSPDPTLRRSQAITTGLEAAIQTWEPRAETHTDITIEELVTKIELRVKGGGVPEPTGGR